MSEEATLDEFAESGKPIDSHQQNTDNHPRFESAPADWSIEEIAEIAEVVGGSTPSTSNDDYWGGGILWATPTDITGLSGNTIEETADTLTQEGLESASTHLLPPYSVLMTSRATIGECAVNTVEMATNQGFKSLIPDEDIETWYLHYRMLETAAFLESLGAGSTFDEVSKSVVQSVDIPVPPLPEQRKIATVLYTVDRAIEKTEAIIGRLERVHNGLFRTLIPGGIGHNQYDDVRILGRNVQIPTSWDVTTVSEACSEIIDYRGKNPKFSDKGIPHLRNINIGRGELLLDDLKYISEETYEEWMTRGFPQEGDTLLSTEAPMRKTAVLPEMKFSLSQRLIVLRPGEQFDNQFFAHLMGSPFVQKEYEARATGSTVKGISNYNLQEVTIPVPPQEEQERIAERIDETLETIHINEQEFERLNRLKRGLMQDLLSGTVRTTDTNIEVPEEIAQHG